MLDCDPSQPLDTTMNRCSHPVSLTFWYPAFAALALTSFHWTAIAQTVGRPIPPLAQRGTLVITQPPNVLLNGQPERLSPGARIRGTNNLLALSGTLVGQTLPVRYLREPQGQIHEIWILTAVEAQQSPVTAP